MKLNIQVDIDWLSEDGSLDDQIREEIVLGVQHRISEHCLAKVEKEASASIKESMDIAKSTIESQAINFVNEWLDKEAVITDEWGDTVKTVSIKELVKQNFENLIEKKVNDDGRPSSHYGAKSFIDWKVNKMVVDEVESRMRDFSGIIDRKVKEQIESRIKENVANRFAEMVIQTAHSNHKQLTQTTKD